MKAMDTITKRVMAYSEAHGMLAPGDRVLIGLSGGADSVCLFFLLLEIKEQIPFELRALHVHHGIRREAGEDAAFVKSLCERCGVPFLQENVDVPALTKRLKISEEEAGRMARYDAFEAYAAAWREENVKENVSGDQAQELNSEKAVKVALAHHAGDRAETLLFHLFRGSGLKGLASVPPVRPLGNSGNIIIRPLLCLEREEIETYLSKRGISHCDDATNDGDAYARNRIRHHVLPYAEEEICEGAVRHLNQAAELLSETEEYLAGQTRGAMERCVTAAGNGFSVDAARFLEEPTLLQKRILMELLWQLTPGRKDLGAVHVEAVMDLFSGGTGRKKSLPFGLTAYREYDQVLLRKEAPRSKQAITGEEAQLSVESLKSGDYLLLQFGTWEFQFACLRDEKLENIPEKTYTKWFDCDKIKNTLSIRTRKSGDYLMIRGGDGEPIRKTVKDFMITEKIPREQRSALPLLAEGDEVLWIPGYRMSEKYKVTAETKRILQVSLNGGFGQEEA